MRAYKGFKRLKDGTLMCRDMVYEPGKTYRHNGDILPCAIGFHACHELWQTWRYYPNNGETSYWEVECGGETKESSYDDGKIVCSEITLVRETDTNHIPVFEYVEHFGENTIICAVCDTGDEVFPINKKIAIDKTGHPLFPELYHTITAALPDESLFRVKNNKLWNLVDRNGKTLLGEWQRDISLFHDGFAVITRQDDGLKNFASPEGKLLSETWFEKANVFSEGLAFVSTGDKSGFINTKGETVLETGKALIPLPGFEEGLCLAEENGKYLFIDRKGNTHGGMTFDFATAFKNGTSVVTNTEGKKNHLTREGKLLLDEWADNTEPFTKHGTTVAKHGGNTLLVDKHGKTVKNLTEEGYDEAILGEWYIIARKGRKTDVLTPQGEKTTLTHLDSARRDSENTLIISKQGKHNAAGTEPKPLSDIWFDDITCFINGHAIVTLDKKYNYINKKGKILSDTWLKDANPFFGDFGEGETEEGKILVDRNGKLYKAYE